MFNKLFQRPHAIRRHFNAPLLEERLRYLNYRAEQKIAHSELRVTSFYQLTIIKHLHLKNNNQIITLKEIETAANRWIHRKNRRLKDSSCSKCKYRFIQHAKDWLEFIGRFKRPEPHTPSQVIEFANYMRKERNLSEVTIHTHCKRLRKFFNRIKEEPREFLANLTPVQLDAIQIQKLEQGVYSRYTIRDCASTLRTFLRYAERQGWCRAGIADSIEAPRIYKHETLPLGPGWEDVRRLLKTTEENSPLDIRARAIILLLAVYGLRESEVCRLRLDDFDWEQETFRLKRSKHGPMQQFPLVQTVRQALIRYLKEVRPQRSAYREIFLIFKAPFHPMTSLYNTVALRWKPLHVNIKHHGAHSLRHACATRLINQGMPLKTIADQLGHRNLNTTSIYAKVDLPRLREVANFNLRGVL